MAKKTFEEQEAEIIRQAEEAGVQYNYFFNTTFKRYQAQLKNLSRIEEAFEEDGSATVTKEYVKGRPNIVINPLITEYNKTTDSANKTLASLLRVIRTFNEEGSKKTQEDPLMKAINGRGDYDDENEAESDEK